MSKILLRTELLLVMKCDTSKKLLMAFLLLINKAEKRSSNYVLEIVLRV
jgi:hypothetical protein